MSFCGLCMIQKKHDNENFLHVTIIKYGYEPNIYVAFALVDTYANSGCLDDLCVMFSKLIHPYTITWSTIIDGLP